MVLKMRSKNSWSPMKILHVAYEWPFLLCRVMEYQWQWPFSLFWHELIIYLYSKIRCQFILPQQKDHEFWLTTVMDVAGVGGVGIGALALSKWPEDWSISLVMFLDSHYCGILIFPDYWRCHHSLILYSMRKSLHVLNDYLECNVHWNDFLNLEL